MHGVMKLLPVLSAVVLFSFAGDARASSIVSDPIGDTLTAGYPDVISVQATFDNELLTFVVDFDDVIFPLSALTPSTIPTNTILPFIDIDTDQNPATGFTPVTSRLTPSFGYPPVSLGDEFSISPGGAQGPTDAYVRNSELGNLAFIVPDAFSFSSHSFSLTVPLALLADDGLANYSVFVFGGVAGPADRARPMAPFQPQVRQSRNLGPYFS
jgi:hypothetical protein